MHACNGAGAATLLTSRSRDGSLRGRTSSRLRPMAMATRATAIGKPLPNCPYVLPRSDENTPRTARVVARPSENETALQRPQDPQSSDRTRLSLLLRTWLPSIRSLTLSLATHFLPLKLVLCRSSFCLLKNAFSLYEGPCGATLASFSGIAADVPQRERQHTQGAW